MAKLGGFIKKFTGSIGNVTFKQLNGQTVASEKPDKKASPKRSHARQKVGTITIKVNGEVVGIETGGSAP